MTKDSKADKIILLASRIAPMLDGVHPDIVGGVLADLTAIWLAGHFSGGETKALRATMLKLQVETIEALVEVNEEIIRDTLRQRGEKP